MSDAIKDYGTAARDRYVGATAAFNEAKYSNLPGLNSGPADAYRHIIWAAEMTRRFGS